MTGLEAKIERIPFHGCWEWLGANNGRYGIVRRGGKNQKAHRASWEIHHGKTIPTGKIICHSCDNTYCVNPRHLWLGTYSENALDCSRKGRLNNAAAKLTHCKLGHLFDEGNTRITVTGSRLCRKCHSTRERDARKRKGMMCQK